MAQKQYRGESSQSDEMKMVHQATRNRFCGEKKATMEACSRYNNAEENFAAFSLPLPVSFHFSFEVRPDNSHSVKDNAEDGAF